VVPTEQYPLLIFLENALKKLFRIGQHAGLGVKALMRISSLILKDGSSSTQAVLLLAKVIKTNVLSENCI